MKKIITIFAVIILLSSLFMSISPAKAATQATILSSGIVVYQSTAHYLSINNGGFQIDGSEFKVRANNYDNALGMYLKGRNRVGYIDQAVQECANYKFNTIRTWATGSSGEASSIYSLWQSNPNELFIRFDEFIKICKNANIYIIVDLGVADFFTQGGGNLGTSSSGSFAIYQNWVSQICGRYKNEPQILFWEILNEYEYTGQPTNLVNTFNNNAAMAIKAADPNHLVCTGSGNYGYSSGWDSANNVAKIDITSIHVYSDEIQNMLGTNPSYQTIKTFLNNYIVKSASWGKVLVFGEVGGDVGYNGISDTKPDNQQLLYSLQAITELQSQYCFHSFASGSCSDKFSVLPSQNPQIIAALNQYNLV